MSLLPFSLHKNNLELVSCFRAKQESLDPCLIGQDKGSSLPVHMRLGYIIRSGPEGYVSA